MAIGLLAGVNPQYGVLGALGLMFAIVAMQNITVGFVLFTAASFLDLASSSGSFSGTKAIGLVLFISWMARTGIRHARELGVFVAENAMLTVSLVALLTWATMSYIWAANPSTALSGAVRYALVMTLLPIAFSAVRKREHVVWVLTAFIVGAAISGLSASSRPQPRPPTMRAG